MMGSEQEPLPLDGLDAMKSQQLLGWLYAKLEFGGTVDAAEWNRAITILTKSAA